MFEKHKDLEVYPDVLGLKDVVQYMHISKDTICNICLDEKLKHICIGKLYKIIKENK